MNHLSRLWRLPAGVSRVRLRSQARGRQASNGRKGDDELSTYHCVTRRRPTEKSRMRRALLVLGVASGLVVATAGTLPAGASAAEASGPGWVASSYSFPSDLAPGSHDIVAIRVNNVGRGATDGTPVKVTDVLPEGLVAVEPSPGEGGAGDLKNAESPTLILPTIEHNVWNCTGNGPGEAPGIDQATVISCENNPAFAPELPGGAGGSGLGQEGVRVRVGQLAVAEIGIAVEVQSGAPIGPQPNSVEVSGGGAPSAAASADPLAIGTAGSQFGLSGWHVWFSKADGEIDTQAGSHPYAATISLDVASEASPFGVHRLEPAGGEPRSFVVDLPAGVVGNPGVVSECSRELLNESNCPLSSEVGTDLVTYGGGNTTLRERVYNMQPPPGVAAEVGFVSAGVITTFVDSGLRDGGDYGIHSATEGIAARRITNNTLILWGEPTDPSHLRWRYANLEGCSHSVEVSGHTEPGQPCTNPPGPVEPFLTLPTSCGAPLSFGITGASWLGSEAPFSTSTQSQDAEGNPLPLTGCNQLPFSPGLEAKPTTDVADAPTGLNADVHFPQQGLEDPEALAEADLKSAVVILPKGIAVNPSSANGLTGCSEAQIGYVGKEAGLNTDRYTPGPAGCPDSSKIGTVEVDTPLLREHNEALEPTSEHPLKGSVYVANPGENPFGSLLAIYIVVEDPETGIIIKLAGEVHADPQTGQLTTTVESPQQPFEDFHLDFFNGAGAALRTPQLCGRYETTSDFTPWSTPEGADAHPSDSFQITQSPGGGACATSGSQLPIAPSFEAGTVAPKAGAYSPFVLHLARADGTQEIGKIETTLPEGLLAKLAGVTECSNAAVAQAESRDKIGEGALEQAHPSCPASSEVGIVHVGAGAGPTPYYVSGHAYLAGPYKGAPLSLEIVTPAVAGPYDLGAVAVRTALNIDPLTAQVQAVSDPIPHILQGIPLDVRSISLELSRNQFTLNPTSCAKKTITGAAGSVLGSSASLTVPFQVGECKPLAFKPKLKLSLKGSTKHAGHPALRAVLTYPKGGGYSNIARAQVNLPHSEFIDQGNLNKTCTKPVLLAGACPASTIYGRAKAWTPLLEAPVEGPVYLVGGFGYKLPALVAELDGQIKVLLVGKVDSGPNKGIRNTFETVPDAPVERFELSLKGGPKYSLLENSEPLCAKPQKAIARFTAQNGVVENSKVPIQLKCPKPQKAQGKKHKRHGPH